MATKNTDRYLLSSLNDALGLLEILSHRQWMTLAELSRASGFDKTRVFRMLYTLEHNGLVAKDSDARYTLGLKLLRYGGVVAARQDIVQTARPLMRAFSERTGFASHLGRLNGTRVVTVHIEEAPGDIQVSSRVGMSAPAYATAMGRAILASLPELELAAVCAQVEIRPLAGGLTNSLSDLYGLLDTVRARGWAEDIDERYKGFGSLAVPVFDHTGACVAAVGLVGLSQDVRHGQAEHVSELKALAGELGAALGYAAEG